MQHDQASFWSDIKKYEERLAQYPDSYLFARLADIYLKVGLVDDALHTARQGVARYPGFIAGLRVLALACNEKGLKDECREALETVTTALPDDRDSQLLLGRLYALSGNSTAATRVMRTVLEFYPDDIECRLELESFANAAVPATPPEIRSSVVEEGTEVSDVHATGIFEEAETSDAEGEVIEDIEILDIAEGDIVEEEPESVPIASEEEAGFHHDPLSTATLAELYVQQGFTDKALGIYRAILAGAPDNDSIRTRVAELEADLFSPPLATSSLADITESAAAVSLSMEVPEPLLPVQGEADNRVTILEGWLDNIRRMKACR